MEIRFVEYTGELNSITHPINSIFFMLKNGLLMLMDSPFGGWRPATPAEFTEWRNWTRKKHKKNNCLR